MTTDPVNHPPHYNQYPIEVIDMMIAVFGKKETMAYCLLNAFKYRMRLGHKDDISQDLAKEQWYLAKAKEFKNELELATTKVTNTQLQTTSKQITTMRTQEEIMKRIGEVKDLLNIQKSDLGAYLEWENLKSFVQPEIVNDVESGKIVRKQLTDPKEEILDYLPFAFKKVKEKNGLSCVRSLYHFKSWIWLDDPAFYEAIVKDIETPSEDFGKAPLKKIAKHYGYKVRRK